MHILILVHTPVGATRASSFCSISPSPITVRPFRVSGVVPPLRPACPSVPAPAPAQAHAPSAPSFLGPAPPRNIRLMVDVPPEDGRPGLEAPNTGEWEPQLRGSRDGVRPPPICLSLQSAICNQEMIAKWRDAQALHAMANVQSSAASPSFLMSICVHIIDGDGCFVVRQPVTACVVHACSGVVGCCRSCSVGLFLCLLPVPLPAASVSA